VYLELSIIDRFIGNVLGSERLHHMRAGIHRFRWLGQLAPAVLLAACGDEFGPVDLGGRWE
jgi:hypothetical protein